MRRISLPCKQNSLLSRDNSLSLPTSKRPLARHLVIRRMMGTSQLLQRETRRTTRRTLPTHVSRSKMRNGGRCPPRMVNLMRNHTVAAHSTSASILWLGEIICRKNVTWVKNALNSRSRMWTHRPPLWLSASPTGCPLLPTWSTTWQTNDWSDRHGHGGPPRGYCSWLRPVSTLTRPKFLLQKLIVSTVPIYGISETINLFVLCFELGLDHISFV